MKVLSLLKQPWLIAPEALEAIAAASFLPQPPDPLPPDNELLTVDDGIGIVSICGIMLRNPDPISKFIYGATDVEEIGAAIRDAVSRPDVHAIFLDIDSPGGTVMGTPELAQAVADASREKFVYAFSGGLMCSAAYWVASQCDAIYATPSARVGSIGVIRPVVDSTEAFLKEGIKVEVFAAGKFKSIGTPGVPLTGDQRSLIQSEVEEIASDFKTAVLARGRKISDETMEGQSFNAKTAQRLNLAGTVKNREEALARLRALHVRAVDTAASAMKTIEEQFRDASDRMAALEKDAQAHEALMAESTARFLTIQSERDQLANDLATARQSLESLSTKNKELEAREQDLSKRASVEAARIAAEMGSQPPAHITPKGDAQASNLYEQFKSISDPKEQTQFWRNLTPAQRAVMLIQSNQP